MRTSMMLMPKRDTWARLATSARVWAISWPRRPEMMSLELAVPRIWRRDEFTSRSMRSSAVLSSRRVR
jgi:hypothetical protein